MVEIPEIDWDMKERDEEILRKQNKQKQKNKEYKEFRNRLINDILEGIALISVWCWLGLTILWVSYFLGFWHFFSFSDETLPLYYIVGNVVRYLLSLPGEVQGLIIISILSLAIAIIAICGMTTESMED